MTKASPEIENLTHRLERLEHENRRYKRTGIALLVALGSVLLVAQARPQRTVEAEAFVLKDSTGKTRAWLGMSWDGGGVTIGRDGKVVETRDATESGPTLQFLDKDGKMRVLLGVKRDWAGQSAYLSLLDKHGTNRSGLRVGEEGSPSISLGP